MPPLIWMIGNAVMVVSTLICVSYLMYERRLLGKTPFPIASAGLIAVIVLATATQFVYPQWLALAVRNPEGLRDGELWRLVTPIFVQPGGIGQCIANAFLVLSFMPYTEKLYGKRGMLIIFFTAGIGSQAFTNFWLPNGGGTSSAAFGLSGALLCYLLRHRKQLKIPFQIIPALGLLAGFTVGLFKDGHGPGMWIGAAASLLIPYEPWPAKTGTVGPQNT